MIPQDKHNRKARSVLLAASLFGLAGCVSVAPLEPIKNPPTYFRSDNAVDVEFLSPAVVGIRCAERGTAFYGMPVFHAMACGNGKLVTMPDACATFTGGAYADLVCDARNQVKTLRDSMSPFLWTASLSAGRSSAVDTTEQTVSDGNAFKVEFVHPASVAQRCVLLGAAVMEGEEEGLRSCATPERIVLPNPCMQLEGGWYSRTLCHEMAHANGWAMDHPGGSFLSDKMAGVDPADVPPPRAVMASLSSGAPLRKASESPTYLAFAAAKVAPPVQYAALTQPAVLQDQVPHADAALRDILAALKVFQARVPVLVDEAKMFAANFDLTGLAQPRAAGSARLLPAAAPDLFDGVRLYEASLASGKAPSDPAHVQFAALRGAEAGEHGGQGVQPVVLLATVPVDLAASLAEADGLVMASADVDQLADENSSGSEAADPLPQQPGRRELAAVHKALVLRRETAPLTPASEAELAKAEASPTPNTPSLKPLAPPVWREDADQTAAAGV